MRSLTRIGVATTAAGLLGAGVFVALTVTAGTAHAGNVTSCDGTGTPISCTIASTAVTSPQTMELNAVSGPAGMKVNLSWTVDCTLAGADQTKSGTAQSTTPAWQPLVLGFTNPDSCKVTATATLPGTTSTTSTATPNAPTLTLNLDYNPQPGASSSPTPSASPSSSSARPPTVQQVRGFDGTCVDDSGNSSSIRAKVVIWTCNNADQAQSWAYYGSELHHNNLCINAKGNGKSGSRVILWTCNGSANEIWIHRSNGEYVEKANGYKLCLDDPGYSTRNGTQLMVYACHNSPNQHWSLP
jgi:hypothetical protein